MKKILETLLSKSDAQLARLAGEGSNDAFDALTVRHSKPIQKFLLAVLHNRTLAKDAHQDVMLEVLKQLRSHRYKERGQFSLWLRTLAYRIALSARRKQRVTVSEELFAEAATILPEEERDVVSEERIRALQLSLSKLNERMRTVVKLRIKEELSFPEIATQLHTGTRSVTKFFSRAVKMLKKMLRK